MTQQARVRKDELLRDERTAGRSTMVDKVECCLVSVRF
jgi:hypothetical protein